MPHITLAALQALCDTPVLANTINSNPRHGAKEQDRMLKHRLFALTFIMPALLIACEDNKTKTPPPLEKAAPSQSAPETASTTQQSSISPSPQEQSEPDPNIALVKALPAPYNTADYTKGRRQYSTCRSCHLLAEGAGHRVGPNLHGMFGRNIGALEDFKYSKAVLAADFEWTPEKLDAWLANPRKFLPGNRMTFAGISNETQRKNLIAYLLVETEK